MDLFNIGLQMYCVTLSILTLWLIGDKNKLGFVIGMATQFVWVAIFILNGTYFLLITSIVYFTMYLRGYLKWAKERR